MKMILLVLLASLSILDTGWVLNLEEAEKIATDKHELILLNFSGSDWCGPCIRLRKEIFNSEEFIQFSNKNLVLLNADFPRSNKNKLSKDQIKQNELLADKYNPKGKFPLTLLLSADGKILKEWDGLPDATPAQFTKQVKDRCDANR